jgi:3-oxoacyl-[acyl-carrier-protein] synthase III
MISGRLTDDCQIIMFNFYRRFKRIQTIGTGVCVRTKKFSNHRQFLSLDTNDECIRSHIGIVNRYVLEEGTKYFELVIGATMRASVKNGIPSDEIILVFVAKVSPVNIGFQSTAYFGLEKRMAVNDVTFHLGVAYAMAILTLPLFWWSSGIWR